MSKCYSDSLQNSGMYMFARLSPICPLPRISSHRGISATNLSGNESRFLRLHDFSSDFHFAFRGGVGRRREGWGRQTFKTERWFLEIPSASTNTTEIKL